MKITIIKLIQLFIPIFFLSCKKENNSSQENHSNKKENVQKALIEEKGKVIDTIYWDNDKNKKSNNYAFIRLLDEIQKDTITYTNFQIDFYKKSENFCSTKLQVDDYDESETYWVNNDELEWLKGINDPFTATIKTISTEYIGCNTDKNNFLISIENDKIEILHQWSSSKGYGDGDRWGEFKWLNSGEFVFWSQSQELLDRPEGGMLHKFSDSIHFIYKDKKWIKTYKTQKDKVYRTSIKNASKEE
ncbi:MAG: hypothetical protein QM535_08580 [Limnohabitans sp.]|nr:hypothetical protein [Limnohabitans sp.]